MFDAYNSLLKTHEYSPESSFLLIQQSHEITYLYNKLNPSWIPMLPALKSYFQQNGKKVTTLSIYHVESLL